MRISDWSSDVCSSDLDSVKSYFGMRKISTGIDPKTGKMALLLNNKPLFQNGTLDQGWWPESLLTPPSEEADRKSDVEGKRVSVRVDLGGRRIIKKQKTINNRRIYSNIITI